VVCGGVQINPGDIVVADDDGVAVIPAVDADVILARAREREIRAAAAGDRLDQGGSTIDVLGLPKEK
jgi:4-hydroxy-4-methyl-2-oxoglutarate aldolase